MIPSLISIVSVFIGIIATFVFTALYKKYFISLSINVVAGVFGSIFLTKAFGRFGVNPKLIYAQSQLHINLLVYNLSLSIIGGILAIIIIVKLKTYIENKSLKSS